MIFLLHLSSMSSFPVVLKEFLGNELFIKIGRNIGNDAKLIMNDFSVVVKPLLELGSWAKDSGFVTDAGSSLKTLVESILFY